MMEETLYVELKHVQELVKLMKARDCFHDWSKEYDEYDEKIKNTIEWIERNARGKYDLRG